MNQVNRTGPVYSKHNYTNPGIPAVKFRLVYFEQLFVLFFPYYFDLVNLKIKRSSMSVLARF